MRKSIKEMFDSLKTGEEAVIRSGKYKGLALKKMARRKSPPTYENRSVLSVLMENEALKEQIIDLQCALLNLSKELVKFLEKKGAGKKELSLKSPPVETDEEALLWAVQQLKDRERKKNEK